MKRNFSYNTVGEIMERIHEEGVNISRSTFYRLEDQGYFQLSRLPGGWRVASDAEVDAIIRILKDVYKIS